MSASYAHILLTRELVNLEKLTNINEFVRDSLFYHPQYVELGSISPDLPALHKEKKGKNNGLI